MPKLILKQKGEGEEKTFNFEREEILLGRDKINTVTLEGAGVSRKHAKIFPDGKDFYLIDLESTGGTKLNGMRLPKNEKYILKHNDIINIEKYDLKFQLIDELLTRSFNDITDSDILEVKLLKKVLRALDRESIPSIEVLNGTAEGKKAFLPDEVTEMTIGRDPMNDFTIEEYVVSRKHAKIAKKWGGVMIQDLGSKNGVYVNNRRVTEEFLHDGDRIALGTIVLMFRNPKEIDLEEMSKRMIEDKRSKEPPPPTLELEKTEEPESQEDEEEASFTGKEMSEEEQKELVKKVEKSQYPIPHTKKEKIKFSFMELCFIGLGLLVFIFAIIMIVNVIFA